MVVVGVMMMVEIVVGVMMMVVMVGRRWGFAHLKA